jgi:hypothetical protein
MSDLRRRAFIITLLGGADRAALDWRLNAVHLPRLAAGTPTRTAYFGRLACPIAAARQKKRLRSARSNSPMINGSAKPGGALLDLRGIARRSGHLEPPGP